MDIDARLTDRARGPSGGAHGALMCAQCMPGVTLTPGPSNVVSLRATKKIAIAATTAAAAIVPPMIHFPLDRRGGSALRVGAVTATAGTTASGDAFSTGGEPPGAVRSSSWPGGSAGARAG